MALTDNPVLTVPLDGDGQPDIAQFQTDIADHLDAALLNVLYLEQNMQPPHIVATAWTRVHALKALAG